MTYHIYYNDEAIGPYEMAQMKEMVESGILTPETLVFVEGAEDWAAASTIEGLFDEAPATESASEEAEDTSEEAPEEDTQAEDSEDDSGEDDTAKAPAAKKAIAGGIKPSLGGAPKQGAIAAKKTGFALKSAGGPKPAIKSGATPAKKAVTGTGAAAIGAEAAGDTLPSMPDNMTPEQKAAYEAAMAKKAQGGGKKRLFILVGVLVLIIAGGVVYYVIK